jgi:hypothetical protein
MAISADGHVTILLSVHEGEPWLDELLSSVRRQQHRRWHLLVRDDGSTDDGMEVVTRHAATDARIRVVEDELGRLGPAGSYLALLDRADPDGPVAFCDQDDVWFPHKLTWSLDALARARHPLATLATDAEVVDAAGRPLAASALAEHGVGTEITLGRLLVNNVAIGATLMATPELARTARALATELPPLMHDWWLALVAAYAGELLVLPAPTMRWRRHARTVTGTTPTGFGARVRRRRTTLEWSICAARLLTARLEPVGPAQDAAARALAAVDPSGRRMSDLLGARAHGVRAWTPGHDAALLIARCAGDRDRTGRGSRSSPTDH